MIKNKKISLNIIKTENNTSTTNTNNNANNNNKKKGRINFMKLKFNKNLLIQILKKTRLKSILEKKSKSQLKTKINSNNDNDNDTFSNIPKKINNFNHISKTGKKEMNAISKLNKNFKNIPGLEKYHNITLEKINDLISTSNDTFRENKKNEINQRIKTDIIKKETIKTIKNKYFDINDININKTNILPYLKLKNIDNKNNKNSINIKDNKDNLNNNNNKNKIYMSKTSNNYATNKWLESIRNSIKRYDIMHRSSRVDRLIFIIENPEGCFEENLLEDIKHCYSPN